MEPTTASETSWLARLRTALACFGRILSNPEFSRRAAALLQPAPVTPPPARVAPPVATPAPVPPPPPERVHASALLLLSLLQREGRLVDFLQEDMGAYSDADIGGAARVVHAGCRKVLAECLTLEPALPEAEGATVHVPAGFDAQRIRLTGNVAGQPPFRGTLKHHGWVATSVRLPAVATALDPRVVAAAEVEL